MPKVELSAEERTEVLRLQELGLRCYWQRKSEIWMSADQLALIEKAGMVDIVVSGKVKFFQGLRVGLTEAPAPLPPGLAADVRQRIIDGVIRRIKARKSPNIRRVGMHEDEFVAMSLARLIEYQRVGEKVVARTWGRDVVRWGGDHRGRDRRVMS